MGTDAAKSEGEISRSKSKATYGGRLRGIHHARSDSKTIVLGCALIRCTLGVGINAAESEHESDNSCINASIAMTLGSARDSGIRLFFLSKIKGSPL